MSKELKHVGFIVDGNRRWARERGLPTLEGHKRGADKLEMVVDKLKDTEIKFVSFYVFSTENQDRSHEEINYLMSLIETKIDKLCKKAQATNLKIIILGRPESVEPKLWQKFMDTERQTKDNTGLTICFCFNYGGKWEIVDAAKRAAEAKEQDWTPESFTKYLYHPEVPNVDLVVRTSGEERISGFMLWRAAYAEFLFYEKKFPDIEANDLDYFLENFQTRERRFGK